MPWAGQTARTAVWLRRIGEIEFIAFGLNCTHLGCPVNWRAEAELFLCPCHGGVYYADGTVAGGPPPRRLGQYDVRIANGARVEILTRPLTFTHGMRRVFGWLDDRLGLTSAVKPLIEHPVPPTGWDYTIGSATLVAFIVQVVTGVALAFSYVPTPDHAYESLEFITNYAILGGVVRGIHFWGASAMVLLVAMHAAQVFLIGAFKYPREVNWLSGTLLLVFTFGMAFTGQLLRWNQDAYWAVVVGAAQAARVPIIGDWLTGILFAGQTVGGATLTRFYATHVFMIPAIVFGLLGLHLYLVIRHGVSEPPEPGVPVDPRTYRRRYDELIHKIGVPFWPDAGWKDVVFALAVGSVVLVAVDRARAARAGHEGRPDERPGLSAPRLVLAVVLRPAGAGAGQHRGRIHRRLPAAARPVLRALAVRGAER